MSKVALYLRKACSRRRYTPCPQCCPSCPRKTPWDGTQITKPLFGGCGHGAGLHLSWRSVMGVTTGAPRNCVLGSQGLTRSRPDVSQQGQRLENHLRKSFQASSTFSGSLKYLSIPLDMQSKLRFSHQATILAKSSSLLPLLSSWEL